MKCNKGYLPLNKNQFDAFGNVRINQESGVKIYGDSLFYDGDNQIAKLRGNVRVVDDKMTLRTNHLDYNTKDNTAWYYGGGTINDDGTNLKSETGFFDSNQSFYSFKGDVSVYKDGYKILADTLKYSSLSKQTYFFGPTQIFTDNKELYAESGIYNTQTEKAWFSQNAWVKSTSYKLSGDSLYYDNATDYGFAIDNVIIESFEQEATIYGDVAINNGLENKSSVFGDAFLVDRSETDTTYIMADTLITVKDTVLNKEEIYAFRNVEIIRGQFSGKCDSLVYANQDSLISFYYDPILWVESSQITGDSIITQLVQSQVDKMYIYNNSFIISQDQEDSIKFNQVKGKDMIAHFTNNELNKLDVDKNVESIYYAFNEENKYIGLNTAICSKMVMYLAENKVKRIKFYDRPISSFIPPQQVTPDKLKLTSFNWAIDSQPQLQGLIERSSKRTVGHHLFPDTTISDSSLVEIEDVTVSKKEDRKTKKEKRKQKKKDKRLNNQSINEN